MRKLKVGGLVYIPYIALPGWSAAAPVHHLIYLHGKAEGKRAKATQAFNAAVTARAQDGVDLSFLASPVTSGGIAVDRFAFAKKTLPILKSLQIA